MDPDHGFTFLQDNLLSSSFSAFEDMRRNDELTDIKINFGSRFFTAHKLIVAAAVPYFRTAFTTSASSITLDQVEPDVFESIVDFAYSGRIQITYGNARSLLLASKFLQLDEMHNACWEFLQKLLQINNAWEIRILAENLHRSEIVDIANDCICQNFEEFSETKEFLDLPSTYLEEIISSDSVKVSSEEKVFEALLRWVEASQSERRALLPNLLNNIRFIYLSTKYLTERILCENLIRNSIPCRLLIQEAELCRTLPEDKKSVFRRFCTQPRIYETKLPHDLYSGIITDSTGIYVVCKSESVISVKYFDCINENWINLTTYSDKFLIDNIVAFSETIYIFLRETILTLDVSTLTWRLLEVVHEPSYSSGLVLHKGKLYLIGGDEDLSQSVRCFDPQLEKWLAEENMPKSCENPGVASLGDHIYVIGGAYEGDVYRSSERYDPNTKDWGQISKMLSERVSHGCASLNGKIYVYGGYNDEYKNLETGEMYDPMTNQWSFIATMKEVSWRISLISNNGKLYAIERMPTCSNKPIDMQIYDPECDEWELGVPIHEKDVCEMFLISTGTPTVQWDDLASNNSENVSDDDESSLLNKTDSADGGESDSNWTTFDEDEISESDSTTSEF